MKYYLAILMLFTSTGLFADSYSDCLDRINIRHHIAIEKAQEILRTETETCYRYPVEDQYYNCQDKAQSKYKKSVKRADDILKREQKSCMKYPWV